MKWKLPIAAVALIGAAAVVTLNSRANTLARGVLRRLATATGQTSADARRPVPPAPASSAANTNTTWDGQIALSPREAEALGLALAEVMPQEKPMELDVIGSTDYDPNTQSKIRTNFLSRIDHVYVELGQSVEKGAPLLDLFSPELVKAKSDYELKLTEWQHDQHELERSKNLFTQKPPAISEKEYLSDANKEKLSQTAHKIARDTLLVYGLTPEEIEKVPAEDGTQKAKMTMRAPISGYVIKRDVVQGNLYNMEDVLLIVAPLEQFWVWGNIYPGDASRVRIGQDWVIEFADLGLTKRKKIESITSDIDPDTKTLRIRTTVENVGETQLRANMLIGGHVELNPVAGRTVIPRLALVSTDGADYAFVRVAEAPARFERRAIRVSQEEHDRVIVAEGLSPGDLVATKGSLILAQMYEDAATNDRGSPP
jgi:cobalt-zinc-cadmium efflux system membrane fusion protein